MNATATNGTIPETMRALVCHGVRDYRLETRPVPVPDETEVSPFGKANTYSLSNHLFELPRHCRCWRGSC